MSVFLICNVNSLGFIKQYLFLCIMKFERQIKYAFDKISNETLNGDIVFKNPIETNITRKKYSEGGFDLICKQCEQSLGVSKSSYERGYFKHFPNQDYCIYKDENFTPKELDKINIIFGLKESDRHKVLKNLIGERLRGVEGIDLNSIAIDNKFIKKDDQKRRPDVYCRYLDKELVFEIQLSDLPLKYILSRYNFYKRNGIYLIWIMDNFDIHDQSVLKTDIKYLTEFQNFFKLDEDTEQFKLICDFKVSYEIKYHRTNDKWMQKSLLLSEVKFSEQYYQIYYYNFEKHKTELELEINSKKQKEIEEEMKRELQQRIDYANGKVKRIIQDISDTKKNGRSFNVLFDALHKLDSLEIEILNKTLDIKNKKKEGKSALNYWICNAKENDFEFLHFLISSKKIYLEVNERDNDGKTVIQEILECKNIRYKSFLMIDIYERGYEVCESDEEYIKNFITDKDDLKSLLIVNRLIKRLESKELIRLVYHNPKLFNILESLKENKIIGFKYDQNNWIAFANNAIQHHGEHWEYIELAFKKFGLWDKLLELDKGKGSFKKKFDKFESDPPRQDYECDEIIKELYPELM